MLTVRSGTWARTWAWHRSVCVQVPHVDLPKAAQMCVRLPHLHLPTTDPTSASARSAHCVGGDRHRHMAMHRATADGVHVHASHAAMVFMFMLPMPLRMRVRLCVQGAPRATATATNSNSNSNLLNLNRNMVAVRRSANSRATHSNYAVLLVLVDSHSTDSWSLSSHSHPSHPSADLGRH